MPKPGLMLFAAPLVTLLALSPAAWAVPITTNESGMDLVFSQASFGKSPIDIRFNAPLHFRNNALVSIDTPAELIALFNLVANGPVGPQSGPINMFSVGQLNTCDGIVNPSIVGCAFAIPNNAFVVEAAFAAGGLGTALNSHELGHDLGLPHVDPSTANLMNPFLQSDTTLTEAQAATVLSSDLVRTDVLGGRFVSITPIEISAVPEPTTLVLWGTTMAGLGLAGRWSRRKQK